MAIIVLVSGDTSLEEWFRECLDEAKHEIVAAATGMEGLGTLETLYANVIVFDTAVGDMSGHRFTDWMRQQQQQDLPVLFLAEPSSDPRAVKALIRTERESLLEKPLACSDVQREIEKLLALSAEGSSP